MDSSYILDILATCQKLQNDYRIVIRAYVEAKSQFFLTITNRMYHQLCSLVVSLTLKRAKSRLASPPSQT